MAKNYELRITILNHKSQIVIRKSKIYSSDSFGLGSGKLYWFFKGHKGGMMRVDKIIILTIIGVLVIVVFYVIGEQKIIGNEASVIGAFRKIKAAEGMCWTTKGYYTDLPDLYSNKLLLLKIEEEGYSGYMYQVVAPNNKSWYAQAKPVKYKSTGVRTFFVDTSGRIVMKDNKGEFAKGPSETSDWEPLIKRSTVDAPPPVDETFKWEGAR